MTQMWTKCSEAMPESKVMVLWYLSDIRICVVGCRRYVDVYNSDRIHTTDGAFMDMTDASHWMPLPPSPEQHVTSSGGENMTNLLAYEKPEKKKKKRSPLDSAYQKGYNAGITGLEKANAFSNNGLSFSLKDGRNTYKLVYRNGMKVFEFFKES